MWYLLYRDAGLNTQQRNDETVCCGIAAAGGSTTLCTGVDGFLWLASSFLVFRSSFFRSFVLSSYFSIYTVCRILFYMKLGNSQSKKQKTKHFSRSLPPVLLHPVGINKKKKKRKPKRRAVIDSPGLDNSKY